MIKSRAPVQLQHPVQLHHFAHLGILEVQSAIQLQPQFIKSLAKPHPNQDDTVVPTPPIFSHGLPSIRERKTILFRKIGTIVKNRFIGFRCDGRSGRRKLEDLSGKASMGFSCPISGTPRHPLHAHTHLQHAEKWLKARETRVLWGLLNSGFRFEFCVAACLGRDGPWVGKRQCDAL